MGWPARRQLAAEPVGARWCSLSNQPSDASRVNEPFPSASESPRSSARTSDSRNRRWPPGVRMLPMRPDAAQRVTVFGSTRNRLATSPGVRRRSRFSTSSPFLGHRWSFEHSAGWSGRRHRVSSWSFLWLEFFGVSVLPFADPMRCVHADVPLRLPLTRDCCRADKKVGVVVTRQIRRVTKMRASARDACFPSWSRHFPHPSIRSCERDRFLLAGFGAVHKRGLVVSESPVLLNWQIGFLDH